MIQPLERNPKNERILERWNNRIDLKMRTILQMLSMVENVYYVILRQEPPPYPPV
jgi:hypothetical protein